MRAVRPIGCAALLLAAVGAAAGCAPGDAAPARDRRPRVVSLHDVTTEMVVALDAGELLVGMTELIDPRRELGAAVARVPRVGDLESILARSPTLVLGTRVVRERSPELVEALVDRGVAVALADVTSLEATEAYLAELGARLARPADRLLAEFRAGTEAAGAVEDPVRVFVYDCCDPPFTAGGGGVLDQLITRAGGANVFAELPQDWTHVSWEEVVARAPELIVVHTYDLAGQAGTAEKLARLRRVPGLARVPTAEVPLGCALGGLRSVEGLERLRAAIAEARR